MGLVVNDGNGDQILHILYIHCCATDPPVIPDRHGTIRGELEQRNLSDNVRSINSIVQYFSILVHLKQAVGIHLKMNVPVRPN